MNFTKVKPCIQCGKDFLIHGSAARYCSKACGQRYRYVNNMRTTEYQYGLVSGNWRKYYQRRVCEKGRLKTISVEDLLEIHEKQKGLCALTGVEMTCVLKRGERARTNASLDRIEAGGPYVKENVRLVCAAVNILRLDMDTDEFIDWCKKVANFKGGDHG